ncbi:MAG TPA: 3-methyl-2-oxobutanoate hydroxymethyltransferase [Candidatus Nitrosocosmicus sp.]|nr:3-methyl-2-oxobutanoate hydroxymethyltransferase [Candidatus Nitrosocosmicus sp.]
MSPSIHDIQWKKRNSEKIAVLTAYDFTSAKICEEAGIDIALVGDSAGMVMLGYPNTISVTMEEMIVFCQSVVNGTKNALIVADMPFGSYQVDLTLAVANAVKLIKLGCHAVKIEGGLEVVPLIQKLTECGIPVMGHIGLKPQTTILWQGYKVQGKTYDTALALYNQAIEIEKAGAFSLVLELITKEVSNEISRSLTIPTIGIGSGSGCDGQVLVYHDLLGLFNNFKPKFVKRYLESFSLKVEAVKKYKSEIISGVFPGEEHTFSMPTEESINFTNYLSNLRNRRRVEKIKK